MSSKIVRSSREIIEKKLLMALDDEDKAAIVLSRDDLDALIVAMEPGPALNAKQMSLLDDFKKLRAAAFGP